MFSYLQKIAFPQITICNLNIIRRSMIPSSIVTQFPEILGGRECLCYKLCYILANLIPSLSIQHERALVALGKEIIVDFYLKRNTVCVLDCIEL